MNLTLFDLDPIEKPVPELPRGLDRLAFLFTATEKGNSTGIRFAATIEHAQHWCSLPISSGQVHGTRWAYFWTTAQNFVRHHSGDAAAYGHSPSLDLAGCVDDGSWDDRLEAAGVVKIPLGCIPHHLPGVLVKNAPLHVGCLGVAA